MTDQKSINNTPKELLGHPIGLSTLFFTEMWERMSYYGMRALLVLFMTTSLQEGGLDFTVATAAAIYGLYTGAVYFMGLPGGWIADKLIGAQNAIWYGGIVIMCGHIVLAIPNHNTFFIGLILVVFGTGMLKPNISALVGSLYAPTDQRRDSGYTIYYMGINLGSLIGYFICGYLASNVGWHWGFGAAAVGMAIGLIQYRLTLKNLNGVGAKPVVEMSARAITISWRAILIFIALVALVTANIMFTGTRLNTVMLAQYTAVAIFTIFIAYFAGIFILGKLTLHEKKRLGALFLICLASSCFWAGFEQAGSSLNLFGRDYTERMIGAFEIPPAWFQSANSIFILVFSPFFAWMWIWLGRRMLNPSYGIKCAIGIVIMASGFIVMYFAAHIAASGLKAAPYYLIMTYFLHTLGELCLSPVALSAVSKLSPRRFAGQFMGVFVLTYSIGSVIAGLLAGQFDPEVVSEMPGLYLQITIFSVIIGLIVFVFSLKTRHWERYAEADNT